MVTESEDSKVLGRIAAALERMSPPEPPPPDWHAPAYVWEADARALRPIFTPKSVSLGLLQGIDLQRETLLVNTRRFGQGLPANNALLWGARGMGKSALIKSVHAYLREAERFDLKLIEIHAHDLATLGSLLQLLQAAPFRALIFCDDLAFSQSDADYRALKALLDGGVAGRPDNTLFYATSNRRHLTPRLMSENERSGVIHPDEEVEEKVSLSDRFGLWLGFHACPQDVYLQIVVGYAAAFKLPISAEELRARALTWTTGRSARSGRVAWQFIRDLAGELGVRI